MYIRKRTLPILAAALLLAGIGAILWLLLAKQNQSPAASYKIIYTPETYTETSDDLDNPYQGWYHMYGYTLSDDASVSLYTIQDNMKASGNEHLALLEINLKNYADTKLSAAALSQLETILSTWETADLHLILRFLYDWDGNAQLTEPKSTSLILQHMNQTAQIVNSHADSIYLLQGIFIGNYGEMHGSSHSEIRLLAEHLASVTDPSIYLSVRTPQQWRTVTESFSPLTAETAWKNTTAARLGLFNDGMLGSATDLGTYSSSAQSSFTSAAALGTYSYIGNRAEELEFQNSLCSYVPNGGEAVINNSYNDFEAAVSDLAKMHVSYLNGAYDPSVLDKWKNAVYLGSDCFHGMNGFDYIGRHLGYRYAVTSSNCQLTSPESTRAMLSLTIKNSGFSSSCRPFASQITLLNINTGETLDIPVDSDARAWPADTSLTLQIPLDVESLGESIYAVYYSLKDTADGRQIKFANTLTADDTFGYPIASLQISK